MSDSPSMKEVMAQLPRTTPISSLWGHIVGTNTLGPPLHSETSIPPLAPLDRNATSMRVLLHDTQANFEKFSARVDILITGMEEAKREVQQVHTLFERDRDSLSGDIIDIVNRSQTQIQKSLGTPSQAPELERIYKHVDHRLEGLDQRLDAMQMFNQTHTQTLHTQVQALQALQDQQNTLVAAVLPLLPLLQSVPVHIEAAKMNLQDAIQKISISHAQQSTPLTIQTRMATRTGTLARKRSRPIQSNATTALLLTNKKPRLDTHEQPADNLGDLDKQVTDFSSNCEDLNPKAIRISASRLFQSSPRGNNRFSPLARAQASIAQRDRQRTLSVASHATTPRRPLSDLPILPPRTKTDQRRGSRTTMTLTDFMDSCSTRKLCDEPSYQHSSRTSSPLLDRGPSAKSSPCIPFMESPISYNAQKAPRSENIPMTSNRNSKQSSPGYHLPSSNLFLNGQLSRLATALPAKVMQSPISASPIAISKSTASLVPLRTPADQKPTSQIAPLPSLGRITYLTDAHTPSGPLEKIRGRRSPIREGRRFIPLVDSDDDDEEEG